MMKQLLLILSILLTCTAAQAQRYRVVADSMFAYDNDSFKLYEVIHYAYSGDRGSNATNDTVDYDTCIVYRYNRMVFYDSGRRPPIIYEKSSKPRLAEKTVRVRNAQGQIDTVYHYKPVLRDTLDLASITVYNRRPDGQPYAKDVYGLVYCQSPDWEVPRGEPEEDTLINGEWHFAIPQAYALVAQPKVAVGYRITQKDSFEYKDGVLQKERDYFLFYDEGETGSIEYFEYDDFDILKKCKEVKQYENGNMVLWENYNENPCKTVDYSKTKPYYRVTAGYFADGSRQSYGVNVVSDMDTLLVDTANVMRDVYGRDSATYYYGNSMCNGIPRIQYAYYDKKDKPIRYVEFASNDIQDDGNGQTFVPVKKWMIKYDNKGKLLNSKTYDYDGKGNKVRSSTIINKYSKEGCLKETVSFYNEDLKNKTPTSKHTYTYQTY